MIKLGELIAKLSYKKRRMCVESDKMYSVVGMETTELIKCVDFKQYVDVLEPIIVELEAKFFSEAFSNDCFSKSDCYYAGKRLYRDAVDKAVAEIRRREKNNS